MTMRLYGLSVIFISSFFLTPLFSIGQTDSKPFLDSLKILSDPGKSKIEVWYAASESLQRSRPDVVLTVSRWMVSQSKTEMEFGMAYEQMGNGYYYKRKADSCIWAYKTSLNYYQKGHAQRKVFTLYNYLEIGRASCRERG